jgi:hypothetical protein
VTDVEKRYESVLFTYTDGNARQFRGGVELRSTASPVPGWWIAGSQHHDTFVPAAFVREVECESAPAAAGACG